jgi:thiamine-monophosphate kinase
MAGEFDFIDWLRTRQTPSELVALGIGDDLAILNWPKDDLVLVGVDQVLDGVHFDSTVHSPRAIGKKAMNRNLSDCAAMGCLPAAALATVALPKGVVGDYAKELYLGLREAADQFSCEVVGGDTGSWAGKLVLTVTIMGRIEGVPPVTRAGAKPGEGIFVTGPLGGSILGKHMDFEPQVSIGRALAAWGVSAMIDLSDGLSRDLWHICRASNVGAIIEASRIPVSDAAIEMRRDGHSPLEHALHDGEDYELLYVAANNVRNDFPGRRIGRTTAEPGIFLDTNGVLTPLEPKGWEHTL